MTASLVLMIIALICLFLAAIPIPLPAQPVQLGWLGMAFWLLATMVR